MTAPAASSQLGWLLKHLDALTDEELLKLNREVSRRAAAIYTVRSSAKQQANWRAAMALREPKGSRSAA